MPPRTIQDDHENETAPGFGEHDLIADISWKHGSFPYYS